MKASETQRSYKRIFSENFIGGIAWALGIFFGTTFLVGILVIILSRLQTIPVIGKFIYNVTQEVEKYK